MKTLRIAMIGQKGIPARFGGVETHVDKIATRLAAGGHDVRVFCRTRFMMEKRADLPYPDLDYEAMVQSGDAWFYRGVRLLSRPSINTKHLDAASHSFLCALESALLHDFDIVHFHGIGPGAFAFLPALAGRVVVATVHALDWRQVKWGRAAKWAMKKGEKIGTTRSRGVIAVSKGLKKYIYEKYGVEARYIPNGADPGTKRPPRLIREYGLEGDDYILAVGRIIPDRGIHDLIAAFNTMNLNLKLVIVGEESPRTAYSERLEKMGGGRVVFTGNLYGEILQELYSNCRLFTLASSVEGLPITVCEAMSYSKAMALSDIEENHEVAGDSAKYFKCGNVSDIQSVLKAMVDDRSALEVMGQAALDRMQREFNWDAVAASIEQYYIELTGQNKRS